MGGREHAPKLERSEHNQTIENPNADRVRGDLLPARGHEANGETERVNRPGKTGPYSWGERHEGRHQRERPGDCSHNRRANRSSGAILILTSPAVFASA